MKVVITGGFGFLGMRLCKRILAIGEMTDANDQPVVVQKIVLFDMSQPPKDLVPQDPRIETALGDVTDAEVCKALVSEDGMCIFHLASIMSGAGEKDFDLCWKVNLEGTRNLLEACRAKDGCKFIFASTGACYGERAPGPELDSTKLLPQTSYGMTKACCELIINDYTRRGFLDGRVARLATIIPRPEVNSGLPAAFSAVIREPFFGRDVTLPVRPDMPHAVSGFRVLVRNLMHLAMLPAAALATSSDRCMNMPSLSLTLQDLQQAVKSIASEPSKLGQVKFEPDEALCAKLGTFHRNMDAARARALGMVGDTSAAAIAADFAAEYVDSSLLKPVLEITEEPRHNLLMSNALVNVFRVENAPGDITLMHIHRFDSLYFFFNATTTQFVTPVDPWKDDSLCPGEVRYGDHGTKCNLTHRIRNTGQRVMFCLDIEFLAFDGSQETHANGSAEKRAKTEPATVPGLKCTKVRPAARVYNMEVTAGSQWKGRLPFSKMLWIVQCGAHVEGDLGDKLVLPGDVQFQEGPRDLEVSVLGSRRSLKLWVVEIL